VRPDSSEQLVGQIQVHDGQWSGSGVIIGQQCANSTGNRFCGQATSAQVSGTLYLDAGSGAERMQGQIQLAVAAASETWTLDLLRWSDEGPPQGTGQFKELLAEFASAGEVIVSFDGSGKFFFQSASSGCVGNGMLAPALTGYGDTSAVTLLVEDCNGSYAYLNGNYEGLAVTTPSSRWDYDSLLRVLLSKSSGETPVAALTMLGDPL
jgi:hypothetical protein